MAKEQETKAAAPEQAQQPARRGPRVQMMRGGGPVADIYVDGVASIATRAGVVKLDLYQAVGFNQRSGTETRRLSHRLVMPAAAIPEMMRIFQGVARSAQAQAQAQTEARAAAEAEKAKGKSGSSKKK